MPQGEIERLPPRARIDEAVWDIVYEKVGQVCTSYLNLISEHHATAKSAVARRYLRKLLADGVKRKKMWEQR